MAHEMKRNRPLAFLRRASMGRDIDNIKNVSLYYINCIRRLRNAVSRGVASILSVEIQPRYIKREIILDNEKYTRNH